MSTHQEILQEEFEVLESIYPDDLQKISDTSLRISVSPEDLPTGEEVCLVLGVEYPSDYPDVIPSFTLEAETGEMSEEEEATILASLESTATESIGMAQTFNVITTLVEAIGAMVEERAQKLKRAAEEKYHREEQAELARKRGTPVTAESFNKWRTTFNAKQRALKAVRDEEKMRSLTPKEREEFKKIGQRLSGRQLFEQNKHLITADDSLIEEGAVSVDITQYDRTEIERAEDARNEAIHFSDSE